MKKWYIVLLIMMCGMLLISCGNEEKAKEKVEEKVEVLKYNVDLEVECNENLLLSKYDVRVLVNDTELGILEHGKTEKYSVELEKGEYVFRVENEEDNTIGGTIKFDVKEDMKLKCKLYCKGDQIEIEQMQEVNPPLSTDELGDKKYKEIKQAFEEAGFTNIEKKVIKDLTEDKLNEKNIVSAIKIGDVSSFTTDDKFMADTKVIIEYHTQADIKMSQNVYYYEGMNYQDVENEFKSMGFTNIELETDSSIFSSNEHGEVSDVKIDGNSFEEGDKFPPSAKVVITYCEIEGLAEAERGETITIENNSELAYILSTKDEFDSKIQEFANKYAGEMIEFDAHTADVSKNEDYKTRFNYLIHAGDYSTTSVSGPNFQFHDVNYGDLNLVGNNVPETFGVGLNIHVIAKVGEYNAINGLFELEPVAITMR